MYDYMHPLHDIEDLQEDVYRKKENSFAYVYHKNGYSYVAYIKDSDRQYYYLCRWHPCERRWQYKEVKKNNIQSIEYFKPNPC